MSSIDSRFDESPLATDVLPDHKDAVTIGNRTFLVPDDVSIAQMLSQAEVGFITDGQYQSTPDDDQLRRIAKGLVIEELLTDGITEIDPDEYPAYCAVCGCGVYDFGEAEVNGTTCCLECLDWVVVEDEYTRDI